MASGSAAGLVNSPGFRGAVDFPSGDTLYSNEDSNGIHSDPVLAGNFNEDYHDNRVPKSSIFTAANVYTQPEDSLHEEVIVTVERAMKKHTDNLMRFLEGISSRLSQLELYCYNIDKSIAEMRSDLGHDHGEADGKLNSLDKHLQEVQRAVQMLRDKQELSETQKELAKLQLAQKESSRMQREDKVAKSNQTENLPETHKQQFALTPANQHSSRASFPATTLEQQQSATTALPSQPMTHQPPCYISANPIPNPTSSYLPADSGQFWTPNLVPNPPKSQVDQPLKPQQLPQYQQQWPQPVSVSVPQSHVYGSYVPSQPTNPLQDSITSSMPMQMPPPGSTHMSISRPEVVYYEYGSSKPPQTQLPPQHVKGGSYVVYDGEGNWSHHSSPTHFSQAGYHTLHPPTSAGLVVGGPSPPQFVQNRSYSELIDKLVSVGYRADHVANVIRRLEEARQPVDFDAVFDRLNGRSSLGSQRSW